MTDKNQPAGWRHTVAEIGPGLGGIGSLLVGLAAVLALLVANQGGANPPATTPSPKASETSASSTSPQPTPASSPTASSPVPSTTAGTAPGEPAFTDLLFSNDLDDPVRGIFSGEIQSCENHFDDGYWITTGDQYVICPGALGDASSSLRVVQDVRVEVTAEFGPFDDDPADTFGPGDAGVWCRGVGNLGTGDYYIGSLGPIGYWAIARFDKGEQRNLDTGILPDLETAAGQRRQLRFDCFGEPGGPTVLRFAVDDEEVARVVDPEGLAAGDVGLATTNFGSQPMTVIYRDVTVFGAE